MRPLFFRLLRLSLIPFLVRETIQRRRATLILYHDPDPQTLERHLLLLRRLYTIIPLRTLVESLRAGTTRELPRKALVITFDDGHRGNRGLLELFERLATPVTIFLCAAVVGTRKGFWFKHVTDAEPLKVLPDEERLERLRASGFEETEPGPGDVRDALSDEEIAEMSGPFVDFQSHGLTHPILTRCVEEKARAEITQSREMLASRYGLDVYALSFPNGDYAARELQLAREAGYLCAVTVDLGFNSAATDVYRLKRIGIDDADGLDALVAKTSGVWGMIRRPLVGIRSVLPGS